MARCAEGIRPAQKLYDRWKRWIDTGVFAQIMAGLVDEHCEKMTVTIDATDLKAHRTATGMAA